MRQLRFRSTLVLALVALLAGPACARAAAEGADTNHARQRVQFAAAYAAAQLGGDGWRALAHGLEDYPLQPYLEAAALTRDIGSVSRERVEAFLERYPDTLPARDLRRDYLHELAGRRDWEAFRALYRPGLGNALACANLRARLAAGETLDFAGDLAGLWEQVPLPRGCQPILDWAHERGLLDTDRLWQRVEIAAAKGEAASVTSLVPWMPRGDGIVARRLLLAREDPRAAVAQAVQWKDSLHSRMAVTRALERLARSDAGAAEQAWRRLQGRFAFAEAERHAVDAAIALFQATDFRPEAAARLAALPDAAQTDSTRTWQVRVALAGGDWQAVLASIDALTPELRRDSAWRYWRARALARLGREAEARSLLAELARDADYYGFLAADWLQQDYAICPLEFAEDSAREAELAQHGALQRALEFHAIGMLPLARREWNEAMRTLDGGDRRLAGAIAARAGWHERAIFSFTSGEAMRLYELRFPLAMRDTVIAAATANELDPAWVYAIIRAESAWASDARSGANAWGLMQVLPSTGARVAKQLDRPWGGPGSLLDPETNITLGTYYLAEMARRFDGSPWLAAAAYNAGPGKVSQWLEARGNLPPDVFIDTMPFHETRAYVRRVLAFSVLYDWRLHDTVLPLARRMPHVGQPPAEAASAAQRRLVRCPAPSAQAGA